MDENEARDITEEDVWEKIMGDAPSVFKGHVQVKDV